MHLALNGCVAIRVKVLTYRGKMPLPQIILGKNMKRLIVDTRGSGFQPRILSPVIKPNRRLVLERDLLFLNQLRL
jgi:hypothetical protein